MKRNSSRHQPLLRHENVHHSHSGLETVIEGKNFTVSYYHTHKPLESLVMWQCTYANERFYITVADAHEKQAKFVCDSNKVLSILCLDDKLTSKFLIHVLTPTMITVSNLLWQQSCSVRVRELE